MPGKVVIEALTFSTRAVEGGAKKILARDRARAQRFITGMHPHGPKAFAGRSIKDWAHDKGVSQSKQASFAAVSQGASVLADTNSVDVSDAGVTYTIDVNVGNPATSYTLLIDTGSSNTWIGAGKKYTPTSTATDTRKTFNVSYGSGQVSGAEYTDQVALGDNLVIKDQSIGVASQAQGFNDVDGILGIGPTDLTVGTLSSSSESVPTVTDNLFAEKIIPTPSIGISYVPTTGSQQLPNGELTFGGTDSDKFTGSLSYVDVTSTDPASRYWGIDQTVTYGDSTEIIQSSGITDTGTTLLLLASDSFQKYQKATGGTMDQTTGLLTVTQAQYDKMESLFFQIGDTKYEFTKNAQIWPRSLNSTLGGDEGKIYLVTSDLGDIGGQGLDFIDGFAFLQRFYTVYDWSNGGRIGFAETEHTFDETN